MGFKRGALILEWPEDSEFSGLEVRMKRLSIRQMVEVEKLGDLRRNKDVDEAEVMAAMSALLDAIGEGLLSWNYEAERKLDDGTMVVEPVPATRESLDGLDLDMVLQLVRAWTKAAAGVPLASRPSSPTGEPVPPPDELASWLALSQENLPAPASS
jgi:hypothetical protein